MSLIAQALTSLADVRLALGLYTETAVTATETLTADTANVTFSFANTDIIKGTFDGFAEVSGTASDTVSTAVMTIDYDAGTITFSAARTGNITCSGYEYFAWDYSEDRMLERYINSASSLISKYCNRNFIAETYTEYYKGLGRPKLVLNNYPINYITSVKVDSASLTAGTDYVTADSTYLAQGFLVKENGWTWYGYETGLVPELTAPVDNIQVVYSAGYTLSTLPADIGDACVNLVVLGYNSIEQGSQGLKSLKQGNLAYTWQDDGGKSSILATLDSYKKVVF